MAQFDLRRNIGAGAERYPFLLELQSDFLDGLANRLVAAVTPARLHGQALSRLEIEVTIEDEPHVVLFTDIASVSRSSLGAIVASLGDRPDEFVSALDFLIHGY